MRFLCRADHGEIAKMRLAHITTNEIALRTATEVAAAREEIAASRAEAKAELAAARAEAAGLRALVQDALRDALKAREVPAEPSPAPVAEVPSPVLKPARARRTAAAKDGQA